MYSWRYMQVHVYEITKIGFLCRYRWMYYMFRFVEYIMNYLMQMTINHHIKWRPPLNLISEREPVKFVSVQTPSLTKTSINLPSETTSHHRPWEHYALMMIMNFHPWHTNQTSSSLVQSCLKKEIAIFKNLTVTDSGWLCLLIWTYHLQISQCIS